MKFIASTSNVCSLFDDFSYSSVIFWCTHIVQKNVFPNTQNFHEFSEIEKDWYLDQVTDDEIEEAFKMFDRDNSGTINHNEIKWEMSDKKL